MANEIPSFDEWFEKENGETFEEKYQYHGALISVAFRELSKAMRDYLSFVAKETHK